MSQTDAAAAASRGSEQEKKLLKEGSKAYHGHKNTLYKKLNEFTATHDGARVICGVQSAYSSDISFWFTNNVGPDAAEHWKTQFSLLCAKEGGRQTAHRLQGELAGATVAEVAFLCKVLYWAAHQGHLAQSQVERLMNDMKGLALDKSVGGRECQAAA